VGAGNARLPGCRVYWRGVGEVVSGGFDGIDAHLGRRRDELFQRHRRLGLGFQIEVLAIAVGRDT